MLIDRSTSLTLKDWSIQFSGLIMAFLQGGAARRLGARGAERAARGALVLTPPSFICVALAAVNKPPLFAPIIWLWTGLVLFALCKYIFVKRNKFNYY